MAMGYEGLVLLKVDTLENAALCTGASVPKARQQMASSSAYGGKISGPPDQDKVGIGTPETYDWTAYDGSIDLEVTQDFYDTQIKPWIFDRQKAAVITLQSRAGNLQTFDKCYWSSISLAASDGGALTASISFVAMQRDTYTIGGADTEGRKVGDEIFCTPQTFRVPDPLNPSADSNLIPIPYWNTKVEIDGSLVDFVTWTADLSQDVVKFFGCEGNVNPVEPKFVAVGPMTARFSGDYMFIDSAGFAMDEDLDTLDITLGASAGSPSTLKFKDLELGTATDAVQSPDSLTPIAIEYAAYELTL